MARLMEITLALTRGPLLLSRGAMSRQNLGLLFDVHILLPVAQKIGETDGRNSSTLAGPVLENVQA